MTTIEIDETDARDVTGTWWVPVAAGVLSLLFGFLVLSFTYTTVWAIAIFAGCSFLLTGTGEVAVGLASRGATRWLSLFLGVVALAAGIMAFAWPGSTVLVIARIVAWLLLIRGVVGVAGAFHSRTLGDPAWWMPLAIGLLEIVVAIWAVRYPNRSLVLLVLWVGIAAVSRGLMFLVLGFGLRSADKALT